MTIEVFWNFFQILKINLSKYTKLKYYRICREYLDFVTHFFLLVNVFSLLKKYQLLRK